MRHSGGESLLWTSATVTLYLEVEDKRERRPGTEQKMSVGKADITMFSFRFSKSGGGEEMLRESCESTEALESTRSLLTSS